MANPEVAQGVKKNGGGWGFFDLKELGRRGRFRMRRKEEAGVKREWGCCFIGCLFLM